MNGDMAYRKDSSSKSQFLGSRRLGLPAADLRRAVAGNGRTTQERQWPPRLLV